MLKVTLEYDPQMKNLNVIIDSKTQVDILLIAHIFNMAMNSTLNEIAKLRDQDAKTKIEVVKAVDPIIVKGGAHGHS